MGGHSSIRNGTLGGTITAGLASITKSDIVQTAVLAAIGAIVSYTVSLLLKMLVAYYKRRRQSRKG